MRMIVFPLIRYLCVPFIIRPPSDGSGIGFISVTMKNAALLHLEDAIEWGWIGHIRRPLQNSTNLAAL
jgi:hypothetical protein